MTKIDGYDLRERYDVELYTGEDDDVKASMMCFNAMTASDDVALD